jgi:hypothetical protein
MSKNATDVINILTSVYNSIHDSIHDVHLITIDGCYGVNDKKQKKIINK